MPTFFLHKGKAFLYQAYSGCDYHSTDSLRQIRVHMEALACQEILVRVNVLCGLVSLVLAEQFLTISVHPVEAKFRWDNPDSKIRAGCIWYR